MNLLKNNRTRQVILSLLIFAMVAGCQLVPRKTQVYRLPRQFVPTNYFLSAHYNQLRPRRVVVVSRQSQDATFRGRDVLAEALSVQLRNAGVVEAIVGGTEVQYEINAVRMGRFDEHELVRLSQKYRADAVLYCDLVSMSAYPPLNASVHFVMVDARESIVLLALDASWDTRDPAVTQAFKSYTCKGTGQDDFSSDIYDKSPTEFLNFVAMESAQFVKTLVQ